MKRLLITAASAVTLLASAPVAAAEFVVGPQTSTYEGFTRGYFFTAPVDFILTGLFIPTDASSGSQNLEVLRFAGAPTPYPAQGTNFTSLGLFLDQSAMTTVATSIAVRAGDVIGILGDRGGINSYGSQPRAFDLGGYSVAIDRLGFQGLIERTGGAQSAFTEVGGSYGRINFTYELAGVGGVPEPTAWLLSILGFGFVGAGMRRRGATRVGYAF